MILHFFGEMKMNATRKPPAEEKKRKKRARKEIDAIFKLIKAGCDRLKKFEESMKQVEKIKSSLERFKDVLDPNIVKDITSILDKIDQTTEKTDQFCELADRMRDLTATLYNPAIPRWVQNLTPVGWVGVVGGEVTAVIIAGGLITTFSPWFQATIDVNNQGCEAIQPPQGMPNIPGVTLWTEPIKDGEQGQAKIPPFIQIGVDTTRADTIAISVFDNPVISLKPSGLKSLLINGREIKNQVDFENIGIRENYSLVISCQ
jgi:hypothetical protein